MRRKFRESMLAEEVIIVTAKEFEAVLRYLKRERGKEDKIARSIYEKYGANNPNYVNASAEKARGISIGLGMAIGKFEKLKKPKLESTGIR